MPSVKSRVQACDCGFAAASAARAPQRQRHAEDSLAAGRAFALDRAAVGGGDIADDRQPQPAPLRHRVPRHAEVFFKDHGQVLGGDAAAGVADGEDDRALARRGGQRDPAALRRVRQGVVQEVLQGVLELVGVGGDRLQGAGIVNDQFDAAVLGAGRKASAAACNSRAGRSARTRIWLRPCSSRARSRRLLIITSSRSALSRASTSSSSCFGNSGPTPSSNSRCSTRRMLVSGVFNSWLTVATRLLFTSSSKRKRVMSSRSTAAPSVAPEASRMGRMRGRNDRVRSPVCSTIALSKPSGRYSCRSWRTEASGWRSGSGGSQTTASALPWTRGTTPSKRRAGRVGHLHVLLRIDDEHGIGKRIDRRLAGLLGADQLRLVRLAELAELAGHRVEGPGQLAQLVVGSHGHELVEVARPERRGRFGHGADGIEDGADHAADEEDGQDHAEGDPARVPEQRQSRQPPRRQAGVLHRVLVHPRDFADDFLDLAEILVEPRRLVRGRNRADRDRPRGR